MQHIYLVNNLHSQPVRYDRTPNYKTIGAPKYL